MGYQETPEEKALLDRLWRESCDAVPDGTLVRRRWWRKLIDRLSRG